jgi:hypothetical protein
VTSNVKSSLLVVNSYNIFKGNGPLHISHLILKLYVFIPLYANYFPYYWQNGTRCSKSQEQYCKANKFEYNFLMISRYFILVKIKRIYLATKKLHVDTLKFWTDYGGKYILFSLNFAYKGTLWPTLKGNNSYKRYNFIIRNLQMVYWLWTTL